MSAFGYGSSYSFKDGNFNPGFTDGMGQDPRRIVSKSGIDSMKGGIPSAPSALPSVGTKSSDPFGMDFSNARAGTSSMSPLFGNPAESDQLSFLALRQNVGNLSDPSARIAGSAINEVNPYAYYGGTPSMSDPSGFTASQNASNFQQAFDYLNSAKKKMSFDPTDGNDGSLGGTLNSAMPRVQQMYQQWLNKMLAGGSFGLTGGGLSYGR